MNLILTAAIAAFKAAEAEIPETATDDLMNAAVRLAKESLECIIRIPSRTDADVIAKLTLASELVEWDVIRARLVRAAVGEQLASLPQLTPEEDAAEQEYEKTLIEAVASYRTHGGNHSATAASLGMSGVTLGSRLTAVAGRGLMGLKP